MKNKKLLSTVVASALVATTMAMPVMAAEQSGSVDVDVSTKTGVLRVTVPTQMAMTIDQFEIAQAGAQIVSVPFTMVNHSEMNVKVDVTSTATLNDDEVSLVATKEAATNSKTKGEAWLAVAAQTSDGSYDDLKTGTTDDPVAEDYWDLTESNANVTTFDATSKVANQTFYLEKAADKDGSNNDATEVYTFAVADANKKLSTAYADFYALTDAGVSDDATLQAAVDANDVYVVAGDTDTDGSTHIDAADGAVMTKIAKDTDCANATPPITYAAVNEYYTAAATPTAATAITANGKYMYVAMSTDGGKAGFTYVGKLSDAEEKTWSESDIEKIAIAYTIKGVTSSNYGEVVGNCTYGLYKEPAKDVAPTFETGDGVGQIKYTAGIGDDAVASITKIEMTNPYGTFDGYNAGAAYAAATDTEGVVTFDSAFMAFFTEGATIQAKVTYTTTSGATKDTTVSVKLQ